MLYFYCVKICTSFVLFQVILGSSLPTEELLLSGSSGKLCVFNPHDLKEDLALTLEEFRIKKIGGVVNDR